MHVPLPERYCSTEILALCIPVRPPCDCIPQPHNIRVPVQKRRLSRQKSERNIIDSSEESGGASAPHTHQNTQTIPVKNNCDMIFQE